MVGGDGDGDSNNLTGGGIGVGKGSADTDDFPVDDDVGVSDDAVSDSVESSSSSDESVSYSFSMLELFPLLPYCSVRSSDSKPSAVSMDKPLVLTTPCWYVGIAFSVPERTSFTNLTPFESSGID